MPASRPNSFSNRRWSPLFRPTTGFVAVGLLFGSWILGSSELPNLAAERPDKKVQGKADPERVVIPPVDWKRAELTKWVRIPRMAINPLAVNPLVLHSRPGATKVIYLDFDGHVTQNSYWNQATGGQPIITTAFDIDGTPGSFNAQEQSTILEIWQRVAECYSPFDVDVTTEEPSLADLINEGGADTKWGIRVLFGDSLPSPAPGAGGVAYLSSFRWNAIGGSDVPCFVFQAGVGTYAKYNADAAVHEVGHTLNLYHDGRTSPVEEYYQGQGTGAVAWAPHMGAGYYVPLVQWSKGEYANPSNTEDDLSIITTQNGFGYRPDDYANAKETASPIPGTAGQTLFSVNATGVIERNTDSDWFKITCEAGFLGLNAAGGPVNTMLDIQLSLYNANGVLMTSSNPVNDVTASLSEIVDAGTYYVKIEGVGNGNPLTTGYTKYSSLGQYAITGSFPVKGQCIAESMVRKLVRPGVEMIRLLSEQDQQRFLDELRAYRDDVLQKSATGRQLVAIYYEHGHEVMKTLARRPKLMLRAMPLLVEAQQRIQQRDPETGIVRLPATSLARALEILEELEMETGTETSEALRTVREIAGEFRMPHGDSVTFDFRDR